MGQGADDAAISNFADRAGVACSPGGEYSLTPKLQKPARSKGDIIMSPMQQRVKTSFCQLPAANRLLFSPLLRAGFRMTLQLFSTFTEPGFDMLNCS